MNELTVYQASELATIEDVARFLLIAPEKAVAMRAAIRAIQKAGVAKEVLEQKKEEQRLIEEMILDASVRMGELTKAIPKAPADRGNQYTGGKFAPVQTCQRTKEETIRDLKLSKDQVYRYETLASNKDLVEQEKAQAREEGRMPTRTNVLKMAQERRAAIPPQPKHFTETREAHYTGGGTKEYREERNQIAAIVADMYDPSTIPEFTVDDLVSEIRVNAEIYIKQLRNCITDNTRLLNDKSRPVIAEAIIKNVIDKANEIRRLVYENERT